LFLTKENAGAILFAMNLQDILFICDGEECLKKTDFWKQMRLSIYELRNSSFKCDVRARISFLIVSDDQNSELKFLDLDTFALSKESQPTLFSKLSWKDIKDYLNKQPQEGQERSIGVFYLKSSETSLELKDDAEFCSLLKEKSVKATTVRSVAADNYSSKIRKVINTKIGERKSAKKLFSKKIAVGFAAAIFVAAIVSCAPILARQIKRMSLKYEKVYTGDGDRLIMRSEPNVDSQEIIRLHEDEVVQIVKRGDKKSGEDGEWDQVNYHGLTGFCHNDFFVPAKERDYFISNPDAKFLYGMACCKFLSPTNVDGWEWIKRASDNGVVRAAWELARHYENDQNLSVYSDFASSDLAYSYLVKIDEGSNFVEEQNVALWRDKAKEYKDSGEDKLAKKFTNKANELEADVRTIRQQAARRLSEIFYRKSKFDLASNYYKKALKLGLKPKGDYMYNLAVEFEPYNSDYEFWLKKASDNGHGRASYLLADIKWDAIECREAIKYYSRSYNAGYEKEKSAYYAGLIYWNDLKAYSSAFAWFERVVDLHWLRIGGSKEYYMSCFALGQCYENGYGCPKSVYRALDYYRRAADCSYEIRAEAKAAYDRLKASQGGNNSWY